MKANFNRGQEIAAEVLREIRSKRSIDPIEIAHVVSKRLDAPLRECIETSHRLVPQHGEAAGTPSLLAAFLARATPSDAIESMSARSALASEHSLSQTVTPFLG